MFENFEKIKILLNSYSKILSKDLENHFDDNKRLDSYGQQFKDIIDIKISIRDSIELYEKQVSNYLKSLHYSKDVDITTVSLLNSEIIKIPSFLVDKINNFSENIYRKLVLLNPENIISNFEDDLLFYHEIIKYRDEIKSIDYEINVFFENFVGLRNYTTSENENNFENNYRVFDEKIKFMQISLNKVEENYVNISKNINSLFDGVNGLNNNLSDITQKILLLNNKVDNEVHDLFLDLNNRFVERTQNSINIVNDQIDAAEVIIKNEIDNLKNTTKNFNEFISDETSIKLTNNFKIKSNVERNWYYGFNFISAVIIVVAIIMSYSSLASFAEKHSTNFTQLDLYYLAIRLLFSFLIFSTIAFTNKLANKHYYHWKKNESTYLKLTALKSFIADMSPEKQQEIHEKLIDVYFGKEDLDPTIYKKYDSSTDNLLKIIADKVPNIGAKAKEGSE